MTSIDIARNMVLHSIGAKIDSFEDRLLAQQKVYLIEELGVNMGYVFSLYLDGPYSADLTHFLYESASCFQTGFFPEYRLAQKTVDAIDTVNALADRIPANNGLNFPRWYALLASLRYMDTSWKKDDEDLFDRLRQFLPQYSLRQCRAAYDALRECDLEIAA